MKITKDDASNYITKLKSLNEFPVLDINGKLDFTSYDKFNNSKLYTAISDSFKIKEVIDKFHFPVFIFELDGNIVFENDAFKDFSINWQEHDFYRFNR